MSIINYCTGEKRPAAAPLSVTENGTYTAPTGVNGYSPVVVNVPPPITNNPFYCLRYAGSASNLFYNKDLSAIPTNEWDVDMNLCTSAGQMFSAAIFPNNTKMTISCNSLANMSGLCHYAGRGRLKELTINSTATVTNLYQAFFRNAVALVNALETITLNFSTANVSAWSQAFYCYNGISRGDNLKTIVGTLDFSSLVSETSANQTFAECVALETMTWAPSSLSVSVSLADSPNLTNATLVSIANGLNDSAIGKTLTLHATAKNKLQSIMGSVLDELFVENEQGAVDLGEFITSHKRWQIA